jgi:hypothetical protein
MPRADAGVVYEWSVRWEKAALAMARTKAERVVAIEAHLSRLTDLHKQTKTLVDNGRLSTYYLWATEYYLADTEIELAEAKMRWDASAVAPVRKGGGDQLHGNYSDDKDRQALVSTRRSSVSHICRTSTATNRTLPLSTTSPSTT